MFQRLASDRNIMITFCYSKKQKEEEGEKEPLSRVFQTGGLLKFGVELEVRVSGGMGCVLCF